MSNAIKVTKTTPPSANPILSWRGFTLITLALVAICFVYSPAPKAFGVNPPSEGGYPNGNTAEGEDALFKLTIGIDNTAIGFNALVSNTRGNNNTAVGFDALFSNATGGKNTAVGVNALLFNTKGEENTAIGVDALLSNTTGRGNIAIGVDVLVSNKTGGSNVAIGSAALFKNTNGSDNTANGVSTLFFNTTGFCNTATGVAALGSNSTGSDNTALGAFAGGSTTGSDNTALGASAGGSTTGSDNIALGAFAGGAVGSGSNNIDIANDGAVNESSTIRIGTKGTHKDTFIAGINGVTVPGGVAVVAGPNGHLGTVTSSQRYKDEIKPMDNASEAIFALKPVTFHYKRELDPAGIPQFGLVAEQVEKVNADLVARDDEGQPYTVRYEAVNAMLLNEFLKEHRKLEEQQSTIGELRSVVAQQQNQIQALAAGLQKVSARLALDKPVTRTAIDN